MGGCQGREDEALKVYMQARAAHEACGSMASPAYADTLMNIGDHLNDVGDYKEAMQLFVDARNVYDYAGWGGTLNYAVLLHNMGVCSFRMKNKTDAATYYEHALNAYHFVLCGTDSPQFEELMKDMEEAGMKVPSPVSSPRLAGIDLSGLVQQDCTEISTMD